MVNVEADRAPSGVSSSLEASGTGAAAQGSRSGSRGACWWYARVRPTESASPCWVVRIYSVSVCSSDAGGMTRKEQSVLNRVYKSRVGRSLGCMSPAILSSSVTLSPITCVLTLRLGHPCVVYAVRVTTEALFGRSQYPPSRAASARQVNSMVLSLEPTGP